MRHTIKTGNFRLARQFAFSSFIILLGGMALIGWWTNKQIKEVIFRQLTQVTSAYVQSFIAPYIYAYLQNGYISPAMSMRFSQELSTADFGHTILLLKVWDDEGHILYSNLAPLIGKTYPLHDSLRKAFAGEIIAYVTDLTGEEHTIERQYWDALIEIYTPVYAPGTRDIIAVAEYYLPADALDQDIRSAEKKNWGMLTLATAIIYFIFYSLVWRADTLIQRQAEQLTNQVNTLENLLQQNQALHKRVQRAARRTIELNERFLRRISAELHDGPLQMLGVAALQLDTLMTESTPELQKAQACIQEAMREMRALAAGLRLPEMERLSLLDILERVILRHEQRCPHHVHLDIDDIPPDEALSTETKIAIYRICEEALNNACKHADGKNMQIRLRRHNHYLLLKISDSGPGFDYDSLLEKTDEGEPHLGLISMRERAESLGGYFHIDSTPGEGTTVIVHLPINPTQEAPDV